LAADSADLAAEAARAHQAGAKLTRDHADGKRIYRYFVDWGFALCPKPIKKRPSEVTLLSLFARNQA
jgi:hypothetical protein